MEKITPLPKGQISDMITIRRVVNGWVILPGPHACLTDFTHVAVTPDDVAKHVTLWAKAQQT